jgi:tetratricopeptide (TPR) repeat protein
MPLAEYLLCDHVIDPAHAGPLYSEAIACTQRSSDHLYASYLTNNASMIALTAGDVPAARAYLQQAMQALRAIGDEENLLSLNLGLVLRQHNEPDAARSSFQASLRQSRRSGDRFYTAYASLGLACLAADEGDWHRAAVLHGIAQAFLDRIGQPWHEPEAHYRQDSLDQVRGHLGHEQFERAYANGMALSPDEALDLATGRGPSQHDLP